MCSYQNLACGLRSVDLLSSFTCVSLYNDHILPRILNFVMGTKDIGEERRKCVPDAAGVVLEIGFGAGHNLPFYSSSVKNLIAVDPSVVGAKLARKRIEQAAFPVQYIPLEGERIALPNASVDTAVSTFTLCTIPDVAAALHQVRRVLKPNGQFLFLEHGRSREAAVERWQDRLNGMQKFCCGGCNLNRDIEQLIVAAGFELQSLERYYGKGPKVAASLYRGVARPRP